MSETTNLKLFKHDNPSTNTNEFNVDTALNQNWDKIDEEFGEDRERISTLETDNETNKQDITEIKAKDIDQDKYIAELEAENARLREDLNGLPKGQATDETIYLTDSAEMRFKKFGIGGNSKQETSTKSRNICFTEFSKWESGDYDGNAGTKVSNTARIRLIELLPVKPSTTYYLNLYNSSNYKFIVRIYDINQKITRSPGAITNGDTITTTENEYYIAVIIYNTTTTVNYDTYQTAFKDGTIKPFICLDSETDKNYDEYSVASPSPDYPSEVKSCGDNINYFDEELELGSIDNTTGENAENNSTIRSKNHIAVLSNQELTISNDKQYSNYIYEYDKDKNFIKYTANNQNPYTFITSSTTKYIKFRTIASSKQNDLTTKFKLEKGKVATPYSKHNQGCINEVICNKNIFNPDLAVDNTYQNINNSWIVSTLNYAWTSGLQSIKENTQYSSNYLLVTGAFYDKEKNVIKKNAIYQKTTFTTPQGACYVDFTIYKETLEYENAKQIQIVEGTELGDYEEHKSQTYTIPTQQPFRSIGDIRDTFIKKNNKWYERHYIFRKIFDGTEKYTDLINVGFADYVYFVEINDCKMEFQSSICSHFKNVNSSWEKNIGQQGEYSDHTQVPRKYFVSDKPTVTEFKAWLAEQYNAGTPVYLDYVLKEPLDIECTPEQNEILDKIEQEAQTYKNVTHIYSTDEVSPVNSIEYIKDIETLINKATTVVE